MGAQAITGVVANLVILLLTLASIATAKKHGPNPDVISAMTDISPSIKTVFLPGITETLTIRSVATAIPANRGLPPPPPVQVQIPQQELPRQGPLPPPQVQAKTSKEYFEELGKTQPGYRARNFMWIRCLTATRRIFEGGGNWIDDYGHRLRAGLDKRLEHKCGQANWKFKYLNGQGWGDARFDWDPFLDETCGQIPAVRAAEEIAREYVMETDSRRELYVYNCVGPRDSTHIWDVGTNVTYLV